MCQGGIAEGLLVMSFPSGHRGQKTWGKGTNALFYYTCKREEMKSLFESFSENVVCKRLLN